MPRDTAYLVDILLHAHDALSYTSGIDKEGFFSDSKTYNAVIRCLEVIGEAVKRVSAETRLAHPEIPWSKMAKMRDFLIHAYDRVDLDQIWDTVRDDLPGLVSQLERILPPEGKA